jgi:hypothetical protein
MPTTTHPTVNGLAPATQVLPAHAASPRSVAPRIPRLPGKPRQVRTTPCSAPATSPPREKLLSHLSPQGRCRTRTQPQTGKHPLAGPRITDQHCFRELSSGGGVLIRTHPHQTASAVKRRPRGLNPLMSTWQTSCLCSFPSGRPFLPQAYFFHLQKKKTRGEQRKRERDLG